MQVYSRIATVASCLEGPGPVELVAARPAGAASPVLLLEAYADGTVVAAGTLAVWDLNQALAALLSATSQARRFALRDDGRGRGGYVDVVTGDASADVEVVVTARDGQRASYRCAAPALSADLNAVLHHYLDLTRATRVTPRTIVLPDVVPATARP